jgi:predicted transcriptional regulator
MLSRVAAIRSSSEILETVEDLEPAQRQRFVAIVGAETARLTEVAQSLAAFFDSSHSGTRSITPADEVDDFVLDRGNHFPALEQAAADFRATAAIQGDCRESTLIEYLQRTHSVQVHLRPASALEPADRRQYASFDAAARTLTIVDTAPRATRRFQLARVASSLFHQGRAADAEITDSALLTTPAARRRAQSVLSSYLAAAVLMPYESFHEAALGSRYDIDHLAQRFGASFEQVGHRLTTLRRPGAEGIRFGFMRTDPAGFVTKRLPLPHLLMPRHGNACPLWAIYGAFQSDGAVVRQLVAFQTGDRYLFLARTVEKQRPAFAMPRRLLSVMLACDALHADQTVYADGLDLSAAAPATPVGANCRLCVRRECLYREEDPIIDA